MDRLRLARTAALLLALLFPARATMAAAAPRPSGAPPAVQERGLAAGRVVYWERRLPTGAGHDTSVHHHQRARPRLPAGWKPALPVDTTRRPVARSLGQRDIVARTPRPGSATPGDYARRVTAALAAARRARRDSGRARDNDIARALARLPLTLIVRAGGRDIQPDLAPMRADLAAGGRDARRLAAAIARLAALREALDAPAARASAPDARRLAALDNILRGPPFTSPPTLWTSIIDAISHLIAASPLGPILDAIGTFLDRLFAGSGSSRSANLLIVVVAGLIVAGALVFTANRLFHPFAPRADLPDDAAEDAAGLARVDAAGARARAAARAAAGDYREAVRYLYLSTLLALDESGRLRIDRATGNRDILRQARATPRLAEALAPVVRLFDLFLFGHVPVTRDDYERYRQLNEQALRTSPAPPAPPITEGAG